MSKCNTQKARRPSLRLKVGGRLLLADSLAVDGRSEGRMWPAPAIELVLLKGDGIFRPLTGADVPAGVEAAITSVGPGAGRRAMVKVTFVFRKAATPPKKRRRDPFMGEGSRGL